MNQTTLQLEKLACPSCMHKITNTINELSGVDKTKIIFHTSKARVVFDEALISQKEIMDAVIALGYEASVVKKEI